MNMQSNGRDGMLVWWDSAEVGRSLFTQAMIDAGLPGHAPGDVNKRHALKQVLADTAAQFEQKVIGQRIKLEPLAPDVIGFEAVRVVKGVESNDYPKLWSMVLSQSLAGVPTVRCVTNDPTRGFLQSDQWIDDHGVAWHGAEAAEKFATQRFLSETGLLPGNEAGQLLKGAVMDGMCGLSLSRHSKAYFIPAQHAPQFETLATRINSATEPTGLRLSWFRYAMEEMGAEQIIGAIRTEIAELTAMCDDEIDNCRAEDRKMRSDAIARRKELLASAHSKLAVYERLLGVSLDELRSCIEKTQGTLAMHALLALSA